jgi:serine protease Do
MNAELLAAETSALAEALRLVTVAVHAPGGGGSGVIWATDGMIVTNAHVARSERALVTLCDGREVAARLVARDPRRDLAVLAADVDRLPVATLGDPRTVRPGDIVAALGNPLGIPGALAIGIIHAVEPRGAGVWPRWIRADIRLAPGNSGGPLADARGRVVGINTLIANGLGIAVPATTVSRFLTAAGVRPRRAAA